MRGQSFAMRKQKIYVLKHYELSILRLSVGIPPPRFEMGNDLTFIKTRKKLRMLAFDQWRYFL